MEKRLTRTDLIFSLMFLFMLIVAISAFFYGVKVGSDRVRAEYATTKEQNASSSAVIAYPQQDLVSFYHTVFLSYREFENNWFATRNKWELEPSADLAASLKDLAKFAQTKYGNIQVASVSAGSPLLKQAQTDYLRSLKLFEESFAEMASSAKNLTAEQLIAQLESLTFYQEAVKYALSAQTNYYASMLKWGASVNSDFPDDYQAPENLPLADWQALPLLAKNKAVVDMLAGNRVFAEYLPHDLTARIDQFIASGQAEKLNQTTVNAIAQLLISTDAVRNGDFLNARAKLYANELLPQLPFFIQDQ
jgi:hypothetical protein